MEEEESNSKNIIRRCIGLMTAEQLLELYEAFNGNTFSKSDFDEWISHFI